MAYKGGQRTDSLQELFLLPLGLSEAQQFSGTQFAFSGFRVLFSVTSGFAPLPFSPSIDSSAPSSPRRISSLRSP